MSYFKYEDKMIYYEESGEGITLIMLHGNTSCGKMFEPIVLPDYQGKGIGRKIIETLENDEYGLRANRIEIPASITVIDYTEC